MYLLCAQTEEQTKNLRDMDGKCETLKLLHKHLLPSLIMFHVLTNNAEWKLRKFCKLKQISSHDACGELWKHRKITRIAKYFVLSMSSYDLLNFTWSCILIDILFYAVFL